MLTPLGQRGELHRPTPLDRTFAAHADSVAEMRHLLSGWLGTAFIGHEQLTADIVLAVSEACNNAVIHAYRDGARAHDARSFRVTAERQGSSAHLTVSDDGMGMHPRPDSPGLGLGLALIASLSAALDIGANAGGEGTVVAMRFDGLVGAPAV